MEKFRYTPLKQVGDIDAFGERISNGYSAVARLTQKGVVIESYGRLYKVVSYSEKNQIANAVRVTRPKTIKRLEQALELAKYISWENGWISGDVSDKEFNYFYPER